MSRNKFVLQVALAVFLVLIAALAGQLRKVQREWRSAVRIMPGSPEPYVVFDPNQVDETRENGAPEVLVKFRPGVSANTINEITARFNDRVEDEIESVPGLAAVDDLDNVEAETIAAEYRALPEVEYAEPSYEISLSHDGDGFKHLHPNDARFSEQWALANDGQNGGHHEVPSVCDCVDR